VTYSMWPLLLRIENLPGSERTKYENMKVSR
jgi:hypothetical protein